VLSRLTLVAAAVSCITGCANSRSALPKAVPVAVSPHAAADEESSADSRVIPIRYEQQGSPDEHAKSHSPGMKAALERGIGEIFLPPPDVPVAPFPVEFLKERPSAARSDRDGSLTLASVEQWACENNPTLIQARAQIEGSFGSAIEAGLWPNPRIYYRMEQIGVLNTPGEFVGGAIQQEIITADKRDLSRAKHLERTRTAEWLSLAQEYRVLNDVRTHFFHALGRQQLVEIQTELLKNMEDRILTVREMYNVGQATRAEVHRANVLLQQQRLKLLEAENNFIQSWERLLALTGVDIPLTSLEGSLQPDCDPFEWDEALVRLLSESPELLAAHAKLRADDLTIRREKVQHVPNLFVEAGAGRNNEVGQTVGFFQLGANIPVFDWNQGTVKQAQADYVRQTSEVRRVELHLRQRLADVYRDYLTAVQHVESYGTVIVPESRKAYEIRLDSYQADRIPWTDVLDAEREYLQYRAEMVQHLITLRENEVLIAGYLLHGGLNAAASPTPVGHIDSVAHPR